MAYLIIGLITFLLLCVISGGWYFLFKRFEHRMSERFDDLVERSEESLKSFSDVIEVLGEFKEIAEQGRDDVVQKLVDMGHNQQRLLDAMDKAMEELKLQQGLLLTIKHEQFLKLLETEMAELKKSDKVTDEFLSKFNDKLKKWRSENFARY